jgi:hypothetical protein
MIIIIFDIEIRTRSSTLPLIQLIGPGCAHIAIYIEHVITDSTTVVAAPAEFVIVCHSPICALAFHQHVIFCHTRRNERGGGILHEESSFVAKITVVSISEILAIPTAIVTSLAVS